MSDTSPEVQWRCSCCGTENVAPFGNQGFTCAACGANEIAEGNVVHIAIPAQYLFRLFRGALSTEVKDLLFSVDDLLNMDRGGILVADLAQH